MLTNVKFLVVDDQPPIRAMVTAILKSAGAQWIDFAGDGESALEAIRWRRPDIVITDMLMAGMDGLDLVRTLRRARDRDSAFVPVIMLTARTEVTFVEQARDAGVTEFAAKPISAANLLQRINAVIMRPRPFVRSKVYNGPCRRRRAEGEAPRRRAADRKAK